MPQVIISGASDDLIEFEGVISDEFTVLPSDHWYGDLVAPDGSALRVHVHYDGCWSVGVGQINEDAPLPSWPMALGAHGSTTYSAALVIDIPAGTELTGWEE